MVIVYVLESLKNAIHCVWITGDIEKRIKDHNSGRSKFTSAYLSWNIICTEEAGYFEEERKREKYLKTAAGKKLMLKQISSK